MSDTFMTILFQMAKWEYIHILDLIPPMNQLPLPKYVYSVVARFQKQLLWGKTDPANFIDRR
jgi:hypothetical protein